MTPASPNDTDAPDLRAPWPGLDAFTKQDADRFRGRQSDIDELFRRVTDRTGTVLYGQSGLGKTSLLQAGLTPLLERNHFIPVNLHLIHGNDAPPLMDQVRQATARAIAAANLFEPIPPASGEDFWRYLHRRDVPFITGDGHDARLVLIFDQFEEIFTNGQSTPDQAKASKEFFGQLAELIQGRTPASVKAELEADPAIAKNLKLRDHDYHILIVLREDYYPHLNTAVERFVARDLIVDPQRLLPFDGVSALSAVEEPGQGLLEPSVAEKIVRKVAAAKQRHLSVSFLGEDDAVSLALDDLRIEPALLSLLCSRLNATRLDLQKQSLRKENITAHLVDTMGERVLENFYHDSLHLLPVGQRSAVGEFIEEKLLSESGQYRQQIVTDSAEKTLADSGMTRTEARDAIQLLIKQRLLRIEDRGDVARLELTHDVLCPIIGHFRDIRRTRDLRLRWWKNAAALAAVGLFIVAVGLAIFSAVQTRHARNERAEAEKQRGIAEDNRQKAIASEERARTASGGWYAKDIRSKAEAKELSAAHVLRAHGSENATMNAHPAIGFIAPEPLLSSLRRLKTESTTRRFIWTRDRRLLGGLTATRQLWWTEGDFSEIRWLQTWKEAPSAGSSPTPPEKTVPRPILAATAWKNQSGEEGLLASVEGHGLVFIGADETVSPPTRFFGTDVTALKHDPVIGSTWIGLKTGVVAKLRPNQLVLDDAFNYSLPSPSPFDSEEPVDFPGGKWRYAPEPQDRFSSRYRSDSRDAVWRFSATNDNESLDIPGIDRTIFPRHIAVSPDNRHLLVISRNNTAKLYDLSSVSSDSQKPSGNTGDSKSTPGVKEVTLLDGNTDLLRDVTVTTGMFLKNDRFVTFGEGTLHVFNLANQSRESLGVFAGTGETSALDRPDATAFVRLKVESTREPTLLILSGDEKSIVVISEAKPSREDDENDAPPSPALHVVSLQDREGKDHLRMVGEKTFTGYLAVTPLRQANRMALSLVNGERHSISYLNLENASVQPSVPWEEAVPRILGDPVTALELDAQGGMLCTVSPRGMSIVSSATGTLFPDLRRSWPGRIPESIWSNPLSNGFICFSDTASYWQVSLDNYDPHDPGQPSVDSSDRGMALGVTSFASHPGGQLSLTGTKSGSINLIQGTDIDSSLDAFDHLKLFNREVTALSFSPDGLLVSAADQDGNILIASCPPDPFPSRSIFSESSRNPLFHIAEGPGGAIHIGDRSGIHRFIPDGGLLRETPLSFPYRKLLALTGGSRPAALVRESAASLAWADLSTGEKSGVLDLTGSLLVHPDPPLYEKIRTLDRVIVSPDGSICCLIDDTGRIEFWKFPLGSDAIRIPFSPPPPLPSSPTVVINGTATHALVTSSETGESSSLIDLRHPDLPPRKVDFSIQAIAPLPGKSDFVISSSGRFGTLRCDGEEPVFHEYFDGEFDAIIVSPDGDLVLALAANSDGTSLLIDLANRKPLGPLAAATSWYFESGGLISADGNVIVGLSRTLRWWRNSPTPSVHEAEISTGLTLDSDTNIATLEHHREKLLPRTIPTANPALASARNVLVRRTLHPAILPDSADDIPDRENLPLAHNLAESRAIRTPHPGLSARHYLLADEAGLPLETLVPGQPPSTWPLELTGMVRHNKLLDQLGKQFTGDTDAADNNEGPAQPDTPVPLPEPAPDHPRIVSALGELAAISQTGYTSPSDYHIGLTYLLEQLRERARLLRERSAPSKLDHLNEILELQQTIATLSSVSVSDWNQLGIDTENVRNELKDTLDPASQETKNILIDYSNRRLAAYRASISHAESSRDHDPTVLANWANSLNEHAEYLPYPSRPPYLAAALALAREATAKSPNAYAWQRLSLISTDPAEIIMAAEKRVEATSAESEPEKYGDALTSLGSRYRDQMMFDKSLDTFERYLIDHPDNVYTLVEIGELMRLGGYPHDEAMVPFLKARELEKDLPVDKVDEWGVWCMGLTCEQAGKPGQAREIYGYTNGKHPSQILSILTRLASIHIDAGRWQEADDIFGQVEGWEQWTPAANIATHAIRRASGAEQTALAKKWIDRVLSATADDPLVSWKARARILAALGRIDEALELVDLHIKESPEPARSHRFLHEAHLSRASILAPSAPARALWELALANSHAIIDPANLWGDARLGESLAQLPEYQLLRTTLISSPHDNPAKFVELARFQLAAATAFAKAHPSDPAVTSTEAAARFLGQAVERGWQIPASGLPEPFSSVSSLPAWPAILEESRSAAIDRLLQDARSILTAWPKLDPTGLGKTISLSTGIWPALQAEIPAARSLKRRAGRDLHGNPYIISITDGSVTVSPETAALYPSDSPRPPKFWTLFPEGSSTPKFRSVTINRVMTLGDFADEHGTTIERLNEINGLDLPRSTVLAVGSELYVPVD